ncbi:MAG TPA: glycosyltransferase [Rubricoccaceae bacterium]|nr:glycosyltransferase [Rubricoccaceae bacterium]
MGGAEWSLLDLARSFPGRCTVLLFEDGPFRRHLEAAGVDVGVCPAPAGLLGVRRDVGRLGALQSLPGALAYTHRLAQWARPYDVLYANSQKAFVLGALVAALRRKPLLWHLRNVLSEEGFSASSRALVVRLANRFAARVIANSEATAAAFVARGGRAEKVRVVYNGIDPEPFLRVTEEAARALRRTLGLDGAPVVGCLSRLAPIKGQHVLLEALAALPGVHAIVVGEALFGDEATYGDALRRQAQTLGIAERVHFLGFRTDTPTLLRACDVVVMPSVVPESFGRVIVEGMLAERPVVATRLGAAVELIEDGVTGRLVPSEDAEALAGALGALLAEPEAARRMAQAGRRSALERFSLARMLDGVARQIDAVVAAHRR